MGGCRCSYKRCERATKNSEKDFHFFHYPIRDPDRCLKWITNAKKPHFKDIPEDQLRNKVVCQLHFEIRCFTNSTKKRLVHDAVPTLDAGSEDTKVDEVVLQMVQSNCEGNVYTVGTELPQNELQNVKSYVIQNGNLIPTNYEEYENKTENCEETLPVIEPPIGAKYKNAESNVINVIELTSNKNNIVSEEKMVVSYEEPVYLSLADYQEHNKLPSHPTVNVTCKSEDTVSNKEVPLSKPPELVANYDNIENLSLTIQQHAQDIERLKQVLKGRIHRQKQKKRYNNLQIINSLRGLIPPSLSAAVSIHLFKKHDNFTQSEKTFLQSMYKSSPNGYKLLKNSFKWRLPDVEVVEQLIQINNMC